MGGEGVERGGGREREMMELSVCDTRVAVGAVHVMLRNATSPGAQLCWTFI